MATFKVYMNACVKTEDTEEADSLEVAENKRCLHDRYVTAEMRRDLDGGFWSIDRFFNQTFPSDDIIDVCEDCGKKVRNLCLTRMKE